jgi:hypothetical protein
MRWDAGTRRNRFHWSVSFDNGFQASGVSDTHDAAIADAERSVAECRSAQSA